MSVLVRNKAARRGAARGFLVVVCALCVLVSALTARPSAAQPEPRRSPDVLSLQTLTPALTAAETALVERADAASTEPGAAPLDEREQKSLADLFGARLARRDWQVLVPLLRPSQLPVAPGRVAVDKLLTEVASRLHALEGKSAPKDACEALRRRLERIVGGQGRVLLARSEEATSCLRSAATSVTDCADLDGCLDGFFFLTILGLPGDDVRLVTGGKVPEYIGLPDTWVDAGGTRVFLAAVRRHAGVQVWLQRRDFDVPFMTAIVAAQHEELRLDGSAGSTKLGSGCVRIRVDGDKEDRFHVVVNGRRVDPGGASWQDGAPVLLPVNTEGDAPHELAVLKDVPGGGAIVVFRQDVRSNQVATEGGCYPLDFDARTGGSRLSLVRASTSELCAGAGLDSDRLESEANRALHGLFRDEPARVVDVVDWASSVQGFGALMGVLRSLDGREAREERPVDASRLLREGAEALTRRALGKLVFVHTQCTRRSPDAWDYSVVVRSLEVDSVPGALAPGVPIEALLARALHAETESVSDARQLPSAVRAALARLLGKPSLRFSTPNEPGRQFRDVHYRMEAFLPRGMSDPHVAVVARRLVGDDTFLPCVELNDESPDSPRIQDESPYEDRLADIEPEAHDPPGESGRRATFFATFQPPEAGKYWLEIQLRPTKDGKPVAVARRCVQLFRPEWMYRTDFDVSQVWAAGAEGTASATQGWAAKGTFSALWGMRNWLWGGGTVGYRYDTRAMEDTTTRRERQAFVAGGTLQGTWKAPWCMLMEHRLGAGPEDPSYSCPRVASHWGFSARLSLLMDVGWVHAGGNATGPDVDLDLSLGAGVFWQATPHVAAQLWIEGGIVAADDLVVSSGPLARDGGWTLGAGAGFQIGSFP